jgi:hypothetical protein
VAKKTSFADVENISIAGLTARMGPVGLHAYAERFLIAAEALQASEFPFDPVRPYLACHSIELALKAFLSLSGQKMVNMAKFQIGHQLDAILADADRQGLTSRVALTDDQRTAIRGATTYYAGKLFEYPAVGEALSAYPSMPPLEELFGAARLLVDGLRQPCRDAS